MKTHFPSHWIKPGEFHFCGCGFVLIPLDEITCNKCLYPYREIGKIDANEEQKKKEIEQMQRDHERLTIERIDLANSRIAQGIEPLFWIKQ